VYFIYIYILRFFFRPVSVVAVDDLLHNIIIYNNTCQNRVGRAIYSPRPKSNNNDEDDDAVRIMYILLLRLFRADAFRNTPICSPQCSLYT